MVRSHSLASLLATPLMVYATSWAVTGLPLVNLASVRMVNVQVRPSSLHVYAVARSFSKPMSAFVVRSVDWISGSCTCSPQPQETNGSKPAAGSLLTGMETVT